MPYKNVIFVGYRDNPYNYVKNSDYLVQLSDDESWCNSITEAKVLGTPVVVTNFQSSYEQVKDSYNGIMLDLNNPNYDEAIDKMLSLKNELRNNLNGFRYVAEIDKWNEILK